MFKGLARLLIKMSVFLNSPGYGMNLLNLPLLDKDIVDGNRSFLINCIFVVTLILQLIKIGPQYTPRIPPHYASLLVPYAADPASYIVIIIIYVLESNQIPYCR